MQVVLDEEWIYLQSTGTLEMLFTDLVNGHTLEPGEDWGREVAEYVCNCLFPRFRGVKGNAGLRWVVPGRGD